MVKRGQVVPVVHDKLRREGDTTSYVQWCPRKTFIGGLHDNADESDDNMFEVTGSPRCPVQTGELPKAFAVHLELSCLLQRSRAVLATFEPLTFVVF